MIFRLKHRINQYFQALNVEIPVNRPDISCRLYEEILIFLYTRFM